MPIVIVPDSLEQAIQEKISVAVIDYPELDAERDNLRQDLINVFNEHGHLNVTIEPRRPSRK